MNCISSGEEKKKEDEKQPEKSGNKCHHGPTGKCLNCIPVDLKDKSGERKLLCQHGPNAKCVHCLDAQFISDVAHVSFDNFL